MLNGGLMFDHPRLDALARHVLGETVRRELPYPTLQHHPQCVGEFILEDGRPEREIPRAHPPLVGLRIEPRNADRPAPDRGPCPDADPLRTVEDFAVRLPGDIEKPLRNSPNVIKDRQDPMQCLQSLVEMTTSVFCQPAAGAPRVELVLDYPEARRQVVAGVRRVHRRIE